MFHLLSFYKEKTIIININYIIISSRYFF
uniref:NERD domain-containing protein n=1 Tax=Lepeophtheirus salmonis TaxID=72036 RepID=A0A0K2SXG6_LEPSM